MAAEEQKLELNLKMEYHRGTFETEAPHQQINAKTSQAVISFNHHTEQRPPSLVEGCPAVSHISRSHSSCSADTCRHDPSTVYTQLSYLDSPRSNSSNGFATRRKAGGELSNRHWWLVGLVFLVAATAGVGVGVPLALRGDPSQSLDNRLQTARKILQEFPLIDGHNDLPWNIRSFIHNQLEKLKLNESLKTVEPWSVSNWSHTDIPRLLEGHVGGQFWVAYTPCDSQYQNAVQLTLEQIDLIKRVIKKYSHYLELVTTSQDIKTVFKKGKIASLIAIEGGHGISNSFGSLRMMYELGVRYLTLTHACNTPWATSSVIEKQSPESKTTENFGLTEFGKKIVMEMNRLGMMVDLSHVSTQTMRDTLAITQAPIIFSHSSARALCDNPRNVPDDVLRQVKENRGIVMVSFYADHVSCTEPANVTHVAKHINHIREVAGIDHVGIGADFDGINKTPKGLEDVSRYPWLLAELLRDPRWTVADIRKLIGENIIRVFADVERVRDDLLAKGVEPLEEEIHPEYLKGKTNCTYLFD
ncbi:dipeptidase 1-like [Panulirus ornatus]|uniref:dipeptidase 1-like n=1 Tax=Panulirus ornatus TaxID=150431 RepID=UPI003A893F6C